MRTFLLILSLSLFTSCVGEKAPEPTIEKEKSKEPIVEKSRDEKVSPSLPQSNARCTTAVFVADPHYTDTPLKINSEDEELKYALENYFDQLKSLNADNIIEMTYPRLFVPINRDRFRQYINTMLNSQDLSIVDFKTNLIQMNPVNCLSRGSFSQIRYLSEITINFVNPELYSDELKMRFLADVMRQKYGQENIRINPNERTITIKKEEKLLAIKENGVWTFLGDNPEYRRLYPKILPQEILNRL